MAGDVLRKLFRRKPELPADVVEAQTDLTRLASEQPVLAGLAGQLRELLTALYAEPVRAAAPPLTREQAVDKLGAGVPLLRGETLDIDWPAGRRRLQDVIEVLTQRRPDAAPAIAKVVSSRELDLADVAADVLAGQAQAVHEKAAALELDVPLTASVLSLTLFPVFTTLRAGLEQLMSTIAWEQGYCPGCGRFPKLGELRGLEQLRFMRCGLCASAWPFPRLRCPGCGNRDHHRLGYLHVEGEEAKCRAVTCEECRQYLKVVATLSALTPLRLLVTDAATVHLDLLAAERGYSPLA